MPFKKGNKYGRENKGRKVTWGHKVSQTLKQHYEERDYKKTHGFQDGHEQLNTGRTWFEKGKHYSPETEFQKSQVPWNKNRVRLICNYCGNEYEVPFYRRNNSRFCSIECLGKSKIERVKATCKLCGKEFEMRPSDKRDYCSRACLGEATWFKEGELHPLWNDGSSFEPYPPEFNDRLKHRIHKRDNYLCQLCFNPSFVIMVHHIDYNKYNNKTSNLITLCPSCHSKTNFNRFFWESLFNSLRECN